MARKKGEIIISGQVVDNVPEVKVEESPRQRAARLGRAQMLNWSWTSERIDAYQRWLDETNGESEASLNILAQQLEGTRDARARVAVVVGYRQATGRRPLEKEGATKALVKDVGDEAKRIELISAMVFDEKRLESEQEQQSQARARAFEELQVTLPAQRAGEVACADRTVRQMLKNGAGPDDLKALVEAAPGSDTAIIASWCLGDRKSGEEQVSRAKDRRHRRVEITAKAGDIGGGIVNERVIGSLVAAAQREGEKVRQRYRQTPLLSASHNRAADLEEEIVARAVANSPAARILSRLSGAMEGALDGLRAVKEEHLTRVRGRSE